MQLTPSFPEFVALARAATLVPVSLEFLFDTETAVSAYHKLARPPFGFLLESVVGGETWARYTFFGTEPRAAWKLRGHDVSRWTPEGGWSEPERSDDPLGDFDRLLKRWTPAVVPGLPRFWGGAVGYFGYDTVRLIERLPHAPPDDLGLPDAVFMLTETVVAVDNLFGRARAIHAVETADADPAELRRRYDGAREALHGVVERLRGAPGPEPLALAPEGAMEPAYESPVTREEFEARVRRVQQYVEAGDAFQVVLSRRLSVPLAASAFDLYRALRTLNPSPYLFYLELEDLRLVGSSPETMVRLEEGVVTVRPIAGTRRRGRDAASVAGGAAAPPPRTPRSRPASWPTGRSWPST